MVEVKELQVNAEAVTPKGHRILVMEQRGNRTLVKVVETQKELEIPNWQLVTPVSEQEAVAAGISTA